MCDEQFAVTCLPQLYGTQLLHCVALCHAIQSVSMTPGSDGFTSCAPEQRAQGRESFATLMYLAALTEAKLVLGEQFEQEGVQQQFMLVGVFRAITTRACYDLCSSSCLSR